MADRIDDLYSEKWFADMERTITLLEKQEAAIKAVNDAIKNGAGDAKGAKTIEDLAAAQGRVHAATAQAAAGFDDFNAALKQAEALKAQYNGSTKEILQTTLASAKAAKELAAAAKLQAEAQAVAARSAKSQQQSHSAAEKAARAEKKALDELTNEYGILSKAYAEATLRAKNMVLLQGENSKGAKQAIADAKALGDQLKKLDYAVGQHQRNVGNYKGALTDLEEATRKNTESFSQLGHSVRTIAGELPNIGISLRTFGQSISNNIQPLIEGFRQAREENARLNAEGQKTIPVGKQLIRAFFSIETAVLAVVAGLTYWISNMNNGSKSAQAAEKANQKYAESLKSIDEAAAGAQAAEIARLTALNAIATDTTLKLNQRIDAAREMQRLYPERLAFLSEEVILEGRAADAINSAKDAIIARAKASATQKKLEAAAEKQFSLAEQTAAAKADVDDYLNFLQRNVLALARLRKDLGRPLDIDEIFGGLDASQDDTILQNNLKKKIKTYNQIRDQSLAADREVQQYAQGVADFTKKIGAADDPPEGSVTALRKRISDLKTLIDLQKIGSAEQIASTKTLIDLEKQLAAIEGRGPKAKDLSKSQARDAKREARERERALEQETKDTLEQIKGRYELLAAQDKIAFEDEKKSQRERLNALDRYALAEISIIKVSGAIQGETTEATQARITAAIDKFGKLRIDLLEKEAKRQEQIQKNISGVKVKGAPSQSREEFDEQRLKDAKLYADQSIQFAQNIADVTSALAQKRVQEIDAEIEAVRRRRDAEIEAYQTSADFAFATEREKALRIAAINADAQRQEDELNQRRRREMRTDAAIHKAVTIAKIAIETALAVVHQLTSGDPYTALARAAAVGVVGAAQLAAAIAAPLPEFADGTGPEGSPEGLAKVGERGSELGITPEGKMFLTPDHETKMYLQKGTHIIPADQTAELMKMYALGMPELRMNPGRQYPMDKIMDGAANKIVSAIDRKRFPVQRERPGWWDKYEYLHTR